MIKKLIDLAELRIYLWFIVYLTVIISVFDYNTDFKSWMYEIARNFFLIVSVTLTFYFVLRIFGLNKLPSGFNKIILQVIFSLLVSVIGGTIGWGVNKLLFGFNVTHPALFYLMIFLVSIFTLFSFQSYNSWKESKKALALKKETEERLIQLKTKAELDAIRSKLNPHFLYNTLNSVMSLIHSDPQKAEDMLQKFADLLRNIQQINKREFIKLTEELEIISEYLSIEKIRFGGRLKYNISIDDDVKNEYIPAMILQPIVENSIKHGVSSLQNGNIDISISRTEPDKIIMIIKDSGNGFDDKEAVNGFGISGVKERLQLLYGGDFGFSVSGTDGCRISITIPANNNQFH